MDNQPVDYASLDQLTKQRIAADKLNAIRAQEAREALVKQA